MPEPHRTPSSDDARRFLKIMELQGVILSLSDMHTFAAISFLIAAISQTLQQPRMDMYHMFLVHQIVWMVCNSHQVALFYVYTSRTPHIGWRCAALLTFLALFLLFEALYIWQLVVHEKYPDWCLSDLAASTQKGWVAANVGLVLWSYWPFLRLCMDREDYEKELQGTGAKNNDAGNTCSCGRQAPPEAPAGHPPKRTATRIRYDKRQERFHKFSNGRVALYLIWGFLNSKGIAHVMILVWYCIQLRETGETREYYKYFLDNGGEDKWGFGQVVSITVFVGVVFQFVMAYRSLSLPLPTHFL